MEEKLLNPLILRSVKLHNDILTFTGSSLPLFQTYFGQSVLLFFQDEWYDGELGDETSRSTEDKPDRC